MIFINNLVYAPLQKLYSKQYSLVCDTRIIF